MNFRILSDGTLDGKWGYWGVNESGTEKAMRTSGVDLAGDYNTVGTNPDGGQYKGTLKVAAQGGGYTFAWSNAAMGFGIKRGNNVSVGIGGSKCAFVAYEVKSDGMLDGVWGGYGSYKTGTEKATKKIEEWGSGQKQKTEDSRRSRPEAVVIFHFPFAIYHHHSLERLISPADGAWSLRFS